LKKYKYILLLLLTLTIKSFSQITFEKYYDYGYAETGRGVKQTADSGFIMAGIHGIWFSDSRMLFVKTDKYGNEQWHTFVGNSGFDSYAYSIIECSNGGYAAVGFKSGIGFIEDVFLVRLNNNGDTIWTKQYGTPIQEDGFSIQQTSDMGFVMSFFQQGGYSGIIKTDSLGNEQWTKKYKAFDGLLFRSVFELNSGGFVLSGRLKNDTTGDTQGVLLRTDTNGDSLWLKDYGSITGGTEFMEAKETNDGNIIAVGLGSASPTNLYDFYAVKTDTLGNIIWEKTIGGVYTDECYSVAVCNDGGYILAGATYPPPTNSQAYLLKINSNGDSLWSVQYGNSGMEAFYSVIETFDYGFAAVGFSTSFTNSVYLIKTNAIGTLTNINEQQNANENDFIIYPNPAKDNINIKFKDNSKKTIQLFDITGKIVIEQIISNDTFLQLNTTTFENGIFFLNITSNNNSITKKIIINN